MSQDYYIKSVTS